MIQSKAKIVATIGPATETKEMLLQLAEAGANVFRLNFSHGTHEQHLERINFIREINRETSYNITILQDLQGPKIRVQNIENDGVMLVEGEKLTFVMDETLLGNAKRVGTTYTSMYLDIEENHRILMDDGNLEVKVLEIDKIKKEVVTEVVYGGILKSKKGINLPDTQVNLPALTEKDEKDLYFGLENEVDWVALSFVRSAEDLRYIKAKIHAKDKKTRVISKIEKPEAITHIDEIIKESDGIMVARGDLGVEMDGALVPQLQKEIVRKCIQAGVPVIVATQMLETMKDNPVPTRAETSDVANAILDGASATMLSAETASGKYPIKSVMTMRHIIELVEQQQSKIKVVRGDEAAIFFKNHSLQDYTIDKTKKEEYLSDRMIAGACRLARDTQAKAIICVTNTGHTAFRLSSHRPKAALYVFTSNAEIVPALNLLWGTTVFHGEAPKEASSEEIIQLIRQRLIKEGRLKKEDVYVCVLRLKGGVNDRTNSVYVGME